MTSMTRLRRHLNRWAHYADKVTPGWSTPAGRDEPPRPSPPAGLVRAWLRHDREQLRRNLLHFERGMEGDRGA